MLWQNVYDYDDRGNQIGDISFRADEPVTWKSDSTFDNEGNRIEWLQYMGNALRYKITFRYDKKRRILEEETTEFNAILDHREFQGPDPGRVVYAYDDEKRTKEVATYSSDGSLKERVIHTYDAKGNEVGKAEFKADGSPNYNEVKFHEDIDNQWSKLLGSLTGHTLVEFEYDSRGNWTRKTFLI